MKLNTTQLLDRLRAHGYDFFTGVPCSHFHDLFSVLAAEQKISYVPAPNEGNACAMAAGAAIVGRRAAVILQNSGLGNLINPLTSLAQVNGIPGFAADVGSRRSGRRSGQTPARGHGPDHTAHARGAGRALCRMPGTPRAVSISSCTMSSNTALPTGASPFCFAAAISAPAAGSWRGRTAISH